MCCPLGAVERIDILKDGASSIYGSDAIAGVVNIVTKKGNGGTLEGFASRPTKSGGAEIARERQLGPRPGPRELSRHGRLVPAIRAEQGQSRLLPLWPAVHIRSHHGRTARRCRSAHRHVPTVVICYGDRCGSYDYATALDRNTGLPRYGNGTTTSPTPLAGWRSMTTMEPWAISSPVTPLIRPSLWVGHTSGLVSRRIRSGFRRGRNADSPFSGCVLAHPQDSTRDALR